MARWPFIVFISLDMAIKSLKKVYTLESGGYKLAVINHNVCTCKHIQPSRTDSLIPLQSLPGIK